MRKIVYALPELRRAAAKPIGLAAMSVVLAGLAGCAEAPDWGQRFAVGQAGALLKEGPVPGADQPYPLISSVPERPVPTSESERQKSLMELREDAAAAARARKELDKDASANYAHPVTQDRPNEQ